MSIQRRQPQAGAVAGTGRGHDLQDLAERDATGSVHLPRGITLCQPDRKTRRRRRLAALSIVAATTLWLAGFSIFGQGSQPLPWCLALSAIALSAVLAALLPGNSYEVLVRGSRQGKPLTFIESYAFTYMVLSLSMAALIGASLAFSKSAPVLRREVVDIELVGLKDFQDRKELLPSSASAQPQRRRTSPHRITAQGALAKGQAPARATAGTEPARRENPPPARTPDASRRPAPDKIESDDASADRFLDRAPLPAVSPPAPQSRPSHPAQAGSPFWEEVAPPELVELTDNDGDDGQAVVQLGGRSQGGTGARSRLATYLKELNRKIKRAWNPPRGLPHSAEIQFRIRRDGRLLQVRLLKSSGDAAVDMAAMEAVSRSAPFPALPGEYELEFLDVRYSFNYSVDRLTEVPPPRSD